MKLILRLVSQNGAATAESRALETGALTLGRGADNDWILEDPERILSKTHCRIDQSGDGFLLTDSSTNGVFLNGDPQPVGRGHSRALADGDVIGLGPCRIAATIEYAGAAATLQFDQDMGLPAPPGPSPAAYSGVAPTPGSPFEAPQDEPWLQAIPTGQFGPGLRAAPVGWDAPPDPADYAASGQRNADHPLPAVATDFTQDSEHLPAISTLLRVQTAQTMLPADWMESDPLHDAPAPDVLPRTPVAAAPESASGDAWLAGFLEGAGLPADAMGNADPHEAGRELGALVRAAVEGVRDMLATRAMVKAEMRVDQTIIQAAGNNAMKFAPDIQRCLNAMVGQPPAGFLPGATAMHQGLNDIKFHELALVAALNTVFGEWSNQLDPEVIMATVRGESGLGAMMPFSRDARCWAVYQENYRKLQESGAQNTGGSLLSPLAAAYGRQLRRTS